MTRRKEIATRKSQRAEVPDAPPAAVRIALPAGIAGVVLACFAPTLGHEFVAWDDPINVLENTHFRGLGVENLRWMFSTFLMGHYQPLSWLTLGVDYVGATCVAVLAILSVRQVRVWQDSLTLWNHALELDPNNVSAYVNRGSAFEDRGELDHAMANYEAALARAPTFADALFGRGNVRRLRGDLDGALEDFDRVTQLKPADPRGWANRGGMRHVKADLPGAEADYRRALELAPSDWSFRKLVADNLATLADEKR